MPVVELVAHAQPQLVDEARDVQAAERHRPRTFRTAARRCRGRRLIASSTPGYCTFTATSRPSRSTARWTWPIDAAATGTGSQSRKRRSGSFAQLLADHLLGQARRHRRHVGLQAGQRFLGLGRQALGDEGHHLAQLHDGALHVAELLGHVLGGPDGELLLERGAAFVVGASPRTFTTA